MSLPEFNPPISPSVGYTDAPEVKLVTVDFGGGYSQITSDGPNHIRSVRDLTWEVLTLDQRNEIIGFLKERGGDQAFYWRAPYEQAPMKFTCAKWSETIISGCFYKVNATFRQSFTMEV